MGVLRLERRRTERSGRPFMLALISREETQNDNCQEMMLGIAAALYACTRETDSVGWYEDKKILGVLLTEIGGIDAAAIGILETRISAAIQRTVSAEELSALKITVHIYPSRSGASDGEDEWNGIYRDLHPHKLPKRREHILKRAIDIAGSVLALLMLSPVFAIIAILVKLNSKGPVLFCQKRVGQYGKLFNFYKFRSMYSDNDASIHREYVAKLIDGAGQTKQSNGTYKLTNDPRITPLGLVLRKTSLDELPQFMNVLLGNMSLVGPRPPLPYEFELYRPWHRRRVTEIKPGLTGLWQVEGRSRTTFDQMVRMDIRYANTRSLWLDIKIILQTPAAMFSGKGAF